VNYKKAKRGLFMKHRV